MAKSKRRLSQDQEFQVMKLVLDKFLWLGFAVMAWGMYKLYTGGWAVVNDAVLLFIAGALILVVFMWIIVKEYEVLK